MLRVFLVWLAISVCVGCGQKAPPSGSFSTPIAGWTLQQQEPRYWTFESDNSVRVAIFTTSITSPDKAVLDYIVQCNEIYSEALSSNSRFCRTFNVNGIAATRSYLPGKAGTGNDIVNVVCKSESEHIAFSFRSSKLRNTPFIEFCDAAVKKFLRQYSVNTAK